MDEHEKLLDPNNYKILIQLKKNRRKKLKAKYLTPDFEYSENINEAMIFDNFQDAEKTIAQLENISTEKSKPRVFIKYTEPMEKGQCEQEKT